MSAEPDNQDLKHLAVGLLAVAVALAGFNQATEFNSLLPVLAAAFLAIASRELGQRAVGQLVNAEVDVELSKPGALITLLGAAVGYLASFPFAFILPIYSSFSNRKYESWGYEIDFVWVKRRYFIATFGMIAMLLTAAVSYSIGAHTVSKGISLFALFQLLPLKENRLIEGDTDGAHILIQSGFTWLTFVAFATLGVAAPL